MICQIGTVEGDGRRIWICRCGAGATKTYKDHDAAMLAGMKHLKRAERKREGGKRAE